MVICKPVENDESKGKILQDTYKHINNADDNSYRADFSSHEKKSESINPDARLSPQIIRNNSQNHSQTVFKLNE